MTIYNILQKHELKYQDWKLCQNSYEKRNFFIETSMLIKNFSQVLKTSQHELWVVKFNFLYVNCYTLNDKKFILYPCNKTKIDFTDAATVKVFDQDGTVFLGDIVIFTGSLGILKGFQFQMFS